MIEPHTDFEYPIDSPAEEDSQAVPPIDPRDIYLRALKFQSNIRRWSRTRKAADIRLDAAEHLVTGRPRVEEIARCHKVSTRRVFQTIKEIKFHCAF